MRFEAGADSSSLRPRPERKLLHQFEALWRLWGTRFRANAATLKTRSAPRVRDSPLSKGAGEATKGYRAHGCMFQQGARSPVGSQITSRFNGTVGFKGGARVNRGLTRYAPKTNHAGD